MLQRLPLAAVGPMLLRRRNATPLWLRLIREAEAAAAAAGASLWYVPPDSYAARAVNGPFVGSDGSGGVPAVGSGVVGWLRDAAGGVLPGALGPELVTNGDFSNGTTGWSSSGGSLSVPSGALVVTSAAGGAFDARQSFSTTSGKTYRVTFSYVDGNASGSEFFLIDNGTGTNILTVPVGSPGAYSSFFTATSATSRIFLFTNNSSAGQFISWDNISVREIPGSHATQSTSANRPVLVAAPGAAAAAAGFGALSFDGGDLLEAPAINLYSVGPIAMGWAHPGYAATGAAAFIAMGSTSSGLPMYSHFKPSGSAKLRSFARNDAGGVVLNDLDSAGDFFTSTPAVISIEDTSTQIRKFLNGVQDANAPTYTRTGAMTLNTLSLGAWRRTSVTENMLGQSGFFWIAPGGVTTAQRQAFERLGAFIVGASYPGL